METSQSELVQVTVGVGNWKVKMKSQWEEADSADQWKPLSFDVY